MTRTLATRTPGGAPPPPSRVPPRISGWLALQRAAGNRAVAGLASRATLQRCGPIPPEECPCHDEEPSVQRAKVTDCSAGEQTKVTSALSNARTSVSAAIGLLADRPLNPRATNALFLAFRSSTTATADAVAAQLTAVGAVLDGGEFECEAPDLVFCNEGTQGYTNAISNVVHLCMAEFGGAGPRSQDRTLVHEGAHSSASGSMGTSVGDVYFGPSCGETDDSVAAGTAKRLDMADAYACFVDKILHSPDDELVTTSNDYQGVGIGQIVQGNPTGPVDLNATGKSAHQPMFKAARLDGSPLFVTGYKFRWALTSGGRILPFTTTDGVDLLTATPSPDGVAGIIPESTRAQLRSQVATSGLLTCTIFVPGKPPPKQVTLIVGFSTGQPGKTGCVVPPVVPGKDAAPTLDAAPNVDTVGLIGLARGSGIAVGTWEDRPRVQRLQELLAVLGAPVVADGMYGPGTEASVASFQGESRLPRSGEIDGDTAAALAIAPDFTPVRSDLEGLSEGDGITFGTWPRRPRVSRLQERLTANGAPTAVDGMFGPKTLTALNTFQRGRGYAESNVVDAATASALDAGSATECPDGTVPILT